MIPLDQRLAHRISRAELERRWASVRREMESQGIDVLVMQNSNEHNGGYVRWFTDVAARHGVPITVVFPRVGRMIVVTSGPRGGRQMPADDGSDLFRGVAAVLTGPYGTAECTTDEIDGRLAAGAIADHPHATIGIIGQGAIRWSFGECLRRSLPDSAFVNVSAMVDGIKAVKSAEEISLIERSAALQDEVWAEVLNIVKPGMREVDVASHAFAHAQRLGSTDGLILTGSAPLGTPAIKGHRHFQNRVLQKGDHFTMLIEVNGPGGYYTELGRTCVLGKASNELRDEFRIAVEAQAATTGKLRPGATPADIWHAHNAFMRNVGRPEEKRLFSHGQGYDLVERPSLRDDDPMALAADMNIVVHPTYRTTSVYSWVCDNYLIGAGGARRLHRSAQVITELE